MPDDNWSSRREVLRLGALGTSALAGCTDLEILEADGRDSGAASSTGVPYRMFQHDAKNRGAHPEATGPMSTAGPAWTTADPGLVRTTPVFVDGTLYVAGDAGVFAFDAANGDRRWHADLGGMHTDGPLRTPAVVDDTVYVAGGDESATVVAFEAEDGSERWSRTVGSGPPGEPSVYDGVVSIPRWREDGGIVALETADGNERWSVDVQNPARAVAASGDSVFVAEGAPRGGQIRSNEGSLTALALEDGAERWQTAVGRAPTSPTAVDGTVFLGQDGVVGAYDGSDGTERWAVERELTGFWSTTVTDDLVVACGPKVDDSDDDVQLYGSELIALDVNDGVDRWTKTWEDLTVSVPVATNDAVYLVVGGGTFDDDARVIAISTADGDRLWQFQRPVTARSPPAVTGDRIYVGSDAGTDAHGVYALDSDSTLDAPPTSTDVENVPDDGHPVFQYDVANTGHAPDESAPEGSVTKRWAAAAIGQLPKEPAVVDDTVYYSARNSLTAAATADGTRRWRYDFGDDGPSTALAVSESTVVTGTADGEVIALSAASGKPRWSFDADEFYVFDPPTIIDGTVFAASQAGVDRHTATLYALDATNGNERWQWERTTVGTPAVADDTVYVGSKGRVDALTVADGDHRWTYRLSTFGDPAPTIRDGSVYARGDDSLHAIAADDGTKRWSVNFDSGIDTHPAVDGGTVYVANQHTVHALATADGSHRWRLKLPASFEKAPVVVDGTLFVVGDREDGDGGLLFAVDAEDGTEHWRFGVDETPAAGPVVVDGAIYLHLHTRFLVLESERTGY